MTDHKYCEICGVKFFKKKTVSAERWEVRKHCCRACWKVSITAKLTDEKKFCKTCGKPLIQKPNEHNSAFNRRMYCSTDCVYQNLSDQRKGIKPNKTHNLNLLKFLFNQDVPVSGNDILKVFPRIKPESMFNRLQSLTDQGFIELTDGCYELTDKGQDVLPMDMNKARKRKATESTKPPYIVSVIEFLKEPHTCKEVMDKFGHEKRSTLRELLKYGIVKLIGFVDGYDRGGNPRKLYAYQSTGKPYITQKTRRYYEL